MSFGPVFISVSDQVSLHGRFKGGELALVEGEHQVTWKQLNGSADAIALALLGAGLSKGDRVCLLLRNDVWSLELTLGIWRAGGVVVPLSPMLTSDMLQTMVLDASPELLFADLAYESLAAAATEKTDVTLITPGDPFLEFIEVATESTKLPELLPHDLSNIIYSSGTTGVPKGIAHTHAARLAFAQTFANDFGYSSHSRAISVIPPHSNGAWLTWMPAFLSGATTCLLPEFSPVDFLKAIRLYRPTHGFIVPTICAALLEEPDIESGGLECFECALTAGAPMPAAMKTEFQSLTGGGLWELWGLTESVATIISPSEMAKKPESVGRPATGMDIRLVDEDGAEVESGKEGEIVGRSNSLMEGYWNRTDLTEELEWQSRDGTVYMRTGDIGELDSDGYLTLRGRKKDMIISGGINVFPSDIESVLVSHSNVKDAAVTGIPDERWGERPVAFVLAQDGLTIDPDELLEWTNLKLAKYQRISRVIVQKSDFPRNTLGKVLKGQLASTL